MWLVLLTSECKFVSIYMYVCMYKERKGKQTKIEDRKTKRILQYSWQYTYKYIYREVVLIYTEKQY